MKYTEFEAKVKEANELFKVDYLDNSVCVRDYSGAGLLRILTKETYAIDTLFSRWKRTDETARAKLYQLATELAATPLEEREEPKKYYYRLPYVKASMSYVNHNPIFQAFFYSTKESFNEYQTQFTREEFATIAKENDIPANLHIEEEV